MNNILLLKTRLKDEGLILTELCEYFINQLTKESRNLTLWRLT